MPQAHRTITGLMRLAAIGAALFFLAPRGHAAVITYEAALAPEAPGATGSGYVTVEYDTIAHTLVIDASWSGLSGTTSVAHIHCCTAAPGAGTIGVAVTPGTLPVFPVGTQAGSYLSPLFDLTENSATTVFTASFVTNFAGGVLANAEEALIGGIDAGRAYFNIHTTTFPGGEIRGFLQQVPEPATLALFGLGLGLAGIRAVRQKNRVA